MPFTPGLKRRGTPPSRPASATVRPHNGVKRSTMGWRETWWPQPKPGFVKASATKR